MKKIFLPFLIIMAVAATTGMSSCNFNCIHGSGHAKTEIRRVADFTKIDVSGSYKVIFKQDSSLTLTITADDNLMKHIRTRVKGGELEIYSKRNFCTENPVTIIVGVHNLDEIRASGEDQFNTDGTLLTKDLEFHLSGATNINMNLNAANVSTDGSGLTDMTLTGQASSHHVDISGSCKLHAFNFVVGDYEISTSGASHCEINVLHSLHVSSSGASDVKYKGNPTDVNNDKSGASSLEKVE